MNGIVKWFNNEKGFGFIQVSSLGEDIFVHYSSIKDGGYKSLAEGEKVQFELVQTSKGFQAKSVTRVDIYQLN